MAREEGLVMPVVAEYGKEEEAWIERAVGRLPLEESEGWGMLEMDRSCLGV